MNNFKRRVMDNATELYVDLGLPSGLLWATCNVGATSPEKSGLYYAWGDPNGYSYNGHNFSFANYNSSGANSISTDISVLSGKDMARLSLGTPWRLPTVEEWEELKQNCTVTSVTIDSIRCVRLTSKISGYTDKSIILPHAGYVNNSTRGSYNSSGYYWSSTFESSNYAMCCATYYSNNSINTNSMYRYRGLTIRAVIGGSLNALSEITLNATGNDSKSISVISTDVDGGDSPFTASIDVNWATISVNGTTITITANSDNNTPNIRSGIITLTLTDTGKTFNVTVKQSEGNYTFDYSELLFVSRESGYKECMEVRCSINSTLLDWNIVETNLPSGVNVTKISYDGYPGGNLQWSWDSTDSDRNGYVRLSTGLDGFENTDLYVMFHQSGSISATSVDGGVLINDVEHNIKYILSNTISDTIDWCSSTYRDLDLSIQGASYYYGRPYNYDYSNNTIISDFGPDLLNLYTSGGTGVANTAIMANECPNDTTTNNAAKWCMSQTLNGKQGYLPSAYELYMYSRVYSTVSSLSLISNWNLSSWGVESGHFATNNSTIYFWSSTEETEYLGSCSYAWAFYFGYYYPNIECYTNVKNSSYHHARCAFPAD